MKLNSKILERDQKSCVLIFLFFTTILFSTTGCGRLWSNLTYNGSGGTSFLYSFFQIGTVGASTAFFGTALDSAGNIYAAGYISGGTIGTQYNTHGATDALVVKYDANGNLIWASQLGTTAASSATGTGILVDTSGNVYISGHCTAQIGGTGFVQLATHGSNDLFVSKFNASGVLQWTYEWGEAGFLTQAGYGLYMDSSQNLYIPCFTTGVLGTQFGTHGTRDICIVQILAGGVAGWAEQIGAGAGTFTGSTAGGVYETAIAADALGNLYLAGASSGTVTGASIIGTISTNTNGLLAQLNTGGAVNWVTELGNGGATVLQFFGVAVDSSNAPHVVGTTSSSLTALGAIQYGTHGSDDGFLASFTSGGSLNNMSQLGVGGASTSYGGITLDSFGNAFLIGSTYGSIGTQYGTLGTENLLFARYAPSGAYVQSAQWGVSGSTTTGGYQLGANSQNVFLPGTTTGSFGATQYGTHGTIDGVLTIFNENF